EPAPGADRVRGSARPAGRSGCPVWLSRLVRGLCAAAVGFGHYRQQRQARLLPDQRGRGDLLRVLAGAAVAIELSGPDSRIAARKHALPRRFWAVLPAARAPAQPDARAAGAARVRSPVRLAAACAAL